MGTGYESTHGEDDLEKRQRRTANSLQEFMALGRDNPIAISPVRSKIAHTLNISSRIEKTEPPKEAITAARDFLASLQPIRPYIEYIHKESGKRKYDTRFENTNSLLYNLVTNETPKDQLRYFLEFSAIEIAEIGRYLCGMDKKVSINRLHLPHITAAHKHIMQIIMKLS